MEKIVEQQEEMCEGGMMVDCEGISVSVTSAQFGDLLLGVVLSDSSKGSDQKRLRSRLQHTEFAGILHCMRYVIRSLQICCDTTSSNTGVHIGAVQILPTTLNAQMFWLMCRHHIYEVHISHFMEALTGQKTKGPRRQLYVRLQKVWPYVAKSIQAAASGNKLCLFEWNGVQVRSELHSMALEALQFGQRALELNTFARDDYKKVCELFAVYLGGEVDNFLFHQIGACHEARFLADALYLLTLQMTKKLTNIKNKEEGETVQTSSFFISVRYAPWFMKSYIGFKAPANELAAIKASAALKDDYPTLSLALTKSFMRHTWYL